MIRGGLRVAPFRPAEGAPTRGLVPGWGLCNAGLHHRRGYDEDVDPARSWNGCPAEFGRVMIDSVTLSRRMKAQSGPFTPLAIAALALM
jgi:hypothetical protein